MVYLLIIEIMCVILSEFYETLLMGVANKSENN